MSGTKATAVVLLAVGVIVAVVLAIWPASFSIFGSDVSCGAPALRIFRGARQFDDDTTKEILNECVRRSWYRLILGFVVGGGLAAVGAWLLIASDNDNGAQTRGPVQEGPARPGAPPAGWYADPSHDGAQRWWDGQRWTPHQRSEPDVGG